MAGLPEDSPRIRLRVPAVVVFAIAMVLLYAWFGSGAIRQVQMLVSMIAVALGLIVTFVWFVFFSDATRRTRRWAAGVVAIAIVLGASLLRFRGVTGDLVPIVEFRFAAARVLPEAQPGAAVPVADANPIQPGHAAASTATPEVKAGGEIQAPNASPRASEPAVTNAAARTHVDWPQFLGPARSGVVDGVAIETNWSVRPPRLMWRQPVGQGWAGFAVSGNITVTQEQRGEEERVIAYDLLTGRPLWSHADKAFHDSPLGGVGPRAVPAIDSGQVFSMGATGLLNALDLRTGKAQWSRNVLKEGGAEPTWGVSASPLVHGQRVIATLGGGPGRALAAYDRNTGNVLWTAGDGGLSYSSPVILNLAGRDQIVMLNADSVAAHDPETGALLWSQDLPGDQPNVAQPLAVSKSRVLFSIGYGIGSKVFEVSVADGSGLSSKLVWATPRLKSKFANMIAFEGSVYGLDDGVLVCLDPETGERRWKEGRFGHGQLILAGRHLMVQTEDGEVILIEPRPDRLVETARFRALNGKTWNPPAFAAPFLLVRNDLESAAYDLGIR
jgi:outer membrane protein assembly factor BamB